MNVSVRGIIVIALLLAAPAVLGQANQQRPSRTGEATITIKEQFFNSFLEAIFDNLRPPSTPLTITESDKNRTDESARSFAEYRSGWQRVGRSGLISRMTPPPQDEHGERSNHCRRR